MFCPLPGQHSLIMCHIMTHFLSINQLYSLWCEGVLTAHYPEVSHYQPRYNFGNTGLLLIALMSRRIITRHIVHKLL